MNDKIKPMLAKGAPRPTGDEYPAIFDDEDYIWEHKYDGIRILPTIDGQVTHLQARSGTDKTLIFPELHIETKVPAILDSEVISAQGLSFQDSIQKRMNRKHDIENMSKLFPSKSMVFDVLEVDGENIEHYSLLSRKMILADILIPTDNAELAPFSKDGKTLWTEVLAQGLEGLVGRTPHRLYRGSPSCR